MAFTNKAGLEPFKDKLWLSSPTMHGEELEYIKKAYDANWMSTVGENIDELERSITEYTGTRHGVSLCCGTAALHMAVKLAGIKPGDKVFCSDMTFGATVNPVVYEGGIPVFIDAEYETWNMDPYSLEKAFGVYPEVRVVVMAHLYGTPGKLDEIKGICNRHGAVLIEDAAESLGAVYKSEASGGYWKQTGAFGTYSVVSFNGNKIITGSSGGMFLSNDREAADKVHKWSTQSREAAPWYQHEELGYNYRMSNVVAGIVRGQFGHLEEHIEAKKKIYERYQSGFKDIPVSMNPYDTEKSSPNFWLSCLLIDRDAMCRQIRDEREALYVEEHGKSCPTEILSALKQYNAEGRPIWKPMHMQPIYRGNQLIKCSNNREDRIGMAAGISGNDKGFWCRGASMDIFNRGLCLPSDIKMTEEEQERVIEIVRRCFG